MFRKKVLCIGRNKTGTTSLEAALRAAGYRLGDQARGERLIEDWARRDFRRILRLCRSGNAFQDIPFSLPFTYQAVDAAFPRSRFILTVRDSADDWFDSLYRFHRQLLGEKPSADALLRNRRWAWIWRTHQLVYGATRDTAYDRELYTRHYERHNDAVREYFRHRPDDLLVLSVGEDGAAERLSAFLGVHIDALPHLNASRS